TWRGPSGARIRHGVRERRGGQGDRTEAGCDIRPGPEPRAPVTLLPASPERPQDHLGPSDQSLDLTRPVTLSHAERETRPAEDLHRRVEPDLLGRRMVRLVAGQQ